MYTGSRVTDAVRYHQVRGELNCAVRIVRSRQPEACRWREAVYRVNTGTSRLEGLCRARIEEPLREAVMDLPDQTLQYEVVIDADATGVDLDRGEILPTRTVGEVRRMVFLTGVSPHVLQGHVRLPSDLQALVPVAPVVRFSRRMADLHHREALAIRQTIPSSSLWLSDEDIQQKARVERNLHHARAWSGLAQALLHAA